MFHDEMAWVLHWLHCSALTTSQRKAASSRLSWKSPRAQQATRESVTPAQLVGFFMNRRTKEI